MAKVPSSAGTSRNLRAARVSALLLGTLLASAAPSAASGVICGIVRDAASGAPVPQAGVFIYTASGSYTGVYAVTDSSGAFCTGGIAAGTYDLEVLVNDHLVAQVRNVVVTNETTSVSIGVELGDLRPLSPNPASTSLDIRFQLSSSSSVKIEVVDVQGRLLKGWWSDSQPTGAHSLRWDLRDNAGRPLAPGRYEVRLRAGNLTRTRSFVRIR